MSTERALQKVLQSETVSVPQVLFAALDDPIATLYLALLMRQSVYADVDGWFYVLTSTGKRLMALSEHRQREARKTLKTRGLIEMQRKGQPARWYYRLDWEAIAKAITQAKPDNTEDALAAIEEVAVKTKRSINKKPLTRQDIDAMMLGKAADASQYPEDVREIVLAFSDAFKLDIPKKTRGRGGAYADWIKSARELLSLNNGSQENTIKAINAIANEYKAALKKTGRPPYAVARLGSIVNPMAAYLAAERIKAESKPKRKVL